MNKGVATIDDRPPSIEPEGLWRESISAEYPALGTWVRYVGEFGEPAEPPEGDEE